MNAAKTILPLTLLVAVLPARSESTQQVVHSYVGQKLILRYHGDERNVQLKRKNLTKAAGPCDVAVEVKEAGFDNGRVRFRLEAIGHPAVAGHKNRCRSSWAETTLTVSGFEPKEMPGEVAASLGQVLQTPEAYLAAHGIRLDLPAAHNDEPPVVDLRQPGVTSPRALLMVEATFSEAARRRRHQGMVVVSFIVGRDGRAREPRIVKGLGWGLDEQALRVVPLLRFEPGRQADQPVRARVMMEMNFRMY